MIRDAFVTVGAAGAGVAVGGGVTFALEPPLPGYSPFSPSFASAAAKKSL